MIKIPPKILPSPLSFNVDQLVLNIVSNLICWNFNVFAFIAVAANLFNTSSFWCEYSIKHCIEFITAQKFLVSFPSHGILYRRCWNNVLSLVISDYYHKITSQLWIENSRMTGLKRLQKFPRKCFNFFIQSMILAKLVRLNLAVLKILVTSQEHTYGGVLC